MVNNSRYHAKRITMMLVCIFLELKTVYSGSSLRSGADVFDGVQVLTEVHGGSIDQQRKAFTKDPNNAPKGDKSWLNWLNILGEDDTIGTPPTKSKEEITLEEANESFALLDALFDEKKDVSKEETFDNILEAIGLHENNGNPDALPFQIQTPEAPERINPKSCRTTNECDGARCSYSWRSTEGTCVLLLGIGSWCERDDECSSSFCGWDYRCQNEITCETSNCTSGRCEYHETREEYVCTDLGKIGEYCDEDFDCESKYCDVDNGNKCRVKSYKEETCKSDDDCKGGGMTCSLSTGKCFSYPRKFGNPCGNTDECAKGLVCNGEKECIKPPKQGKNEPCVYTSNCEGDLICVVEGQSKKCKSPEDVTHEVTGNINDPCDDDDDCNNSHLTCNEFGKCIDMYQEYHASTVKNSTIGETCHNNHNCAKPLVCKPKDKICFDPHAINASQNSTGQTISSSHNSAGQTVSSSQNSGPPPGNQNKPHQGNHPSQNSGPPPGNQNKPRHEKKGNGK